MTDPTSPLYDKIIELQKENRIVTDALNDACRKITEIQKEYKKLKKAFKEVTDQLSVIDDAFPLP